RYPWPGNVRELQSVIKQALLHATGPVLLPEFLPAVVRGQGDRARESFDFGGLTEFIHERLRDNTNTLYADYQALTDRHLLNEVIRHTGGNLTHAARFLGITRATLRAKLNALNITIERGSSSEGEPR